MSRPETTLDAWLYPDTNGDTYIIDPATQEAPEGGIPQFVRQDKRLGRGLRAFAEFPVSTEIAFIEHATAADLDMPGDPGWYESATSDPKLDAYTYESLYGPQGQDRIARGVGHIMRFTGEPKRFTSRFYRAVSQTVAASDSFDPTISYKKERIALNLDLQWQKINLQAFFAARHGPALEQTRRCVAAYAVSQIVREGIMPARMGLVIHRAAKRRALEDEHDSYRHLATIGAAHRRQEQLLRGLGAQVTVHELPLTPEGEEQVAGLSILRKGFISAEDVNVKHEQIQKIVHSSG